jgi:hypothetical protein
MKAKDFEDLLSGQLVKIHHAYDISDIRNKQITKLTAVMPCLDPMFVNGEKIDFVSGLRPEFGDQLEEALKDHIRKQETDLTIIERGMVK